MKKFFLPFMAGLALLAPASVFAATFEGKITSQMTNLQAKSGDPAMPLINTSIKEVRQRMDITMTPDPKKPTETMESTVIMDLAQMKMFTLIPSQKMYMVYTIPTPTEEEVKTKAEKPTESTTPTYTVTRTGKKEKILGYTAEEMIFQMNDLTTEIWGTDELGTYMSASALQGAGASKRVSKSAANSQAAQAWEKALSGKNFFPLRTITSKKNSDGTLVPYMKMEVTAVEKKKLDDSLFVPPTDYKLFEMPNMQSIMNGINPFKH